MRAHTLAAAATLTRTQTTRRVDAFLPPRFAHRVLPVEAVCYASMEDVVKAATPLLAAAFPPSDDAAAVGLKYAVVFESRACDGTKLDRMAVINALAALVPKARADTPAHTQMHTRIAVSHTCACIRSFAAADAHAALR
jgi:hypothetical protein